MIRYANRHAKCKEGTGVTIIRDGTIDTFT